MTKEIWKIHPSGLLVSNMGRVKVPRSGKNPEHITYGSSSNGYKIVGYQGKMYRVHRLVAQAFITNPEGKPEVDHINQRRDDNRAENLRWATSKENLTFADQDVQERRAKKRSKPVLQCDLDGNVVKMWPSTNECGRNGYDHTAVSQCCNNKYSTYRKNVYKGYVWRYAEEEAV